MSMNEASFLNTASRSGTCENKMGSVDTTSSAGIGFWVCGCAESRIYFIRYNTSWCLLTRVCFPEQKVDLRLKFACVGTFQLMGLEI